MLENILRQRFEDLQREFNQKLYKFFIAKRDLGLLETDMSRIEASLAEIEIALKQSEKIKQEQAAAVEEAKKANETKESLPKGTKENK